MPQNRERLRILATSDVHMHMMAFNYYANSPAPGLGLSALAGTIAGLRHSWQSGSDAGHVLVLDNGDFLQGTPLGDYFANHPDDMAAIGTVLTDLGYAALGLGNHDLDYGLDHVARFAKATGLPVVSSNLTIEPTTDWLRGYVILPAGKLKVGVISVLPPKTLDWTHATLGGSIAINDMRMCIKDVSQAVRDNGADIVVALAHTGLGTDTRENALQDIAADGFIDALIGGHTHHVFPSESLVSLSDSDAANGTMSRVPTVMPGFGGAVVGCIDLELVQSPDGFWQVQSGTASVVPAHGAGPVCTPALTPLMPAHLATLDVMATPIGEIPTPLTSYFAQVSASDMLAVCAAAQHRIIDEARNGTRYADLPLLSAVAPPRAGGRGGPWNYSDIAAGTVTERSLADLLVFANFVWAVDVSGREIKHWLEQCACSFQHVNLTQPGGLLDPDYPAFNFDVLYGLTYVIDPTQPTMNRIADLRWGDTPVQPEDRFLVALNSYRACGGGDIADLNPKRPVLRPRTASADALRAYIASGDTPTFETPWRFAKNSNPLRCHLRTGPGALNHLGDIRHLNPGTPQLQKDGFVSIPITL